MNVKEDIAFNPGVSAVEIETVVLPSHEHIIDEMNDGVGSEPTGKIDNVAIADRAAEVISGENGVTARFDPAGTMDRLKFSRTGRKMAVAGDKGGDLQRNVLVFGGEE